jgi:hypothetical protein
MRPVKRKNSRAKPKKTSPAILLEMELDKLRRDLRTTVRAYAARLEVALAESRAALETSKPAEELSGERLRDLRDLTILVRKRKLKPEKAAAKIYVRSIL